MLFSSDYPNELRTSPSQIQFKCMSCYLHAVADVMQCCISAARCTSLNVRLRMLYSNETGQRVFVTFSPPVPSVDL